MTILIYVAYTFYFIAALMMIGAILLQEGKGGGLSALGGTQAESAFGASNPVRRMTVVLAVAFFVLAGFLSIVSRKRSVTFGDEKEPAAAAGEEPGEGALKGGEGGEGEEGKGPAAVDVPAGAPEGAGARPAGAEEGAPPGKGAEAADGPAKGATAKDVKKEDARNAAEKAGDEGKR